MKSSVRKFSVTEFLPYGNMDTRKAELFNHSGHNDAVHAAFKIPCDIEVRYYYTEDSNTKVFYYGSRRFMVTETTYCHCPV